MFSPTLSAGVELKSDKEEKRGFDRKHPYTEEWKYTFDWAEKSTLGEQFTFCSTCSRNLKTFNKGYSELQRHMDTKTHFKREQESQPSEPLPCSDAAIRFIQRHCYNGSAKGEQVSVRLAHRKLGLQYPKDITSVCQHTPYCVYIYGGEAIGEDDTVSVVLAGFFDVEASSHCIRFLDALESENGAKDQTAAAVGEILKKFGLPTDNLVAVYLDGNGAASEQICSQLKELNPNMAVFGGMYSISGAACQAGLKQLSNQAQELTVDMYAHYSSSKKNDNLKALFGSITVDCPSSYINFCLLVTKMLEIWTDLVSYFSSCNKNDDKAKLICSRLQDPKVRATFMFLEQALKPLHNFQMHLQTPKGVPRADLLLILEEASNLLSTYTSYFLLPQAAARFLKEHDAQILKDKIFHLSSPELSLGGKAVEDFLNESESVEALPQFTEEVLSFYIALTSCIAEKLPLDDGLLRSIAQLLNPQSRQEVTRTAVGELGTKLGLCSSPEEVDQLTSEFLQYQLAEEGEENHSAEVSLEKHWAGVLRDSKHTVFRRLVLTLLALPCPPLDAQHVFNQVCKC